MKNLSLAVLLFWAVLSYSQSVEEAKKNAYKSPLTAIPVLEEAINEDVSKLELADRYYALGEAYREVKEYGKAFNSFSKSDNLYISENADVKHSDVLMYKAMLFKDVRAYEKSINFYKKTIALKEKLGDKSGLRSCYRNISNVFRKKGAYDSAIHYAYDLAYPAYDGNIKVQSKILNDIGLVYYETEHYDLAVEYYFDALYKVKDTEYETDRRAKTYNNAGNAYLAMGNVEKAYIYLQVAKKLKSPNDRDKYLNTTYNLAKAHITNGHLDSATFYLSSIDDKSVNSEISFYCYDLADSIGLQAGWQGKGLNAYVRRLIREKNLAEMYYQNFLVREVMYQEELEKREKHLMLWYGIGIGAVVVCLLVFLLYNAGKLRLKSRWV